MAGMLKRIAGALAVAAATCCTGALALSAGGVFFPPAVQQAFGGDRVHYAEEVPEGAKVSVGNVPDTALELEWYRSQLDDEQVVLYDAMKAAMYGLRGGVTVDSMDKERAQEVFWAVIYDHPEIFWVERSYTYTYSDDIVTGFDFNYSRTDKAEIESLLEKYGVVADTVIAGATGSDKQRTQYIYQWLAHSTSYVSGPDDQNISSVFDGRESVCAGYTQALQFMFLRAGIPCTREGGHSIDEDGQPSEGNHTWLVAAIGNRDIKYYDVTWDDQYDPGRLDEYFGMSREKLLEKHAVDEGDKAPVKDGERDDSREFVETATVMATGEALEYNESQPVSVGGLVVKIPSRLGLGYSTQLIDPSWRERLQDAFANRSGDGGNSDVEKQMPE